MEMKGIKVLSETDQSVLVQVAAGESWNDFVQWAVDRQLGGLENMVDIPSLIGSVAVSNIWAYGQEASQIISEVLGVNLTTQTIQKLSAEECEFAYRESIFKQELLDQFIITHVVFELPRIDEEYVFTTSYKDIQTFFATETIDFEALSPRDKQQTLLQAIRQIRASKLPNPAEVGTAGSYFKNPKIWIPQREELVQQYPDLVFWEEGEDLIKLSAGQLIELAGWKGKSLGSATVSPKHALVILNTGTKGVDIADLAQQIQESVLEKFGISLEPEVRYC